MSKSRGNVVNPWDHFNKEGSDSIRWYMMTQSAPWSPTNFDPNGVRESYAKMFLTLWNVHRFHADYAALDGFDPDEEEDLLRYLKEVHSIVGSSQDYIRSPMLTTTNSLLGISIKQVGIWNHSLLMTCPIGMCAEVGDDFGMRLIRAISEPVSTPSTEVLLTVCRLMAPVAPFMPDQIHRDLTGVSVHLADWPVGSKLVDSTLPPQDWALEQEMALVRTLAETGRRIRVEADRRQRLPCKSGWIVGGPDISQFHDLLSEELNVESLTTEDDLERFQRIVIEPNRKSLGAKCRQDLPAVLALLAEAEPDNLLLEIDAGICILEGYDITMEDIEIRRVEQEGYAAATISDEDIGDVSLVLDMVLDQDLLSKGLARDIIRRVQSKRKGPRS